MQFRAWRLQQSFVPGSTVTLYATLREYDVPMLDRASVWAEIARPDQTTFTIKLSPGADGAYSASFATTMAGVYFCRVRCEGYASGGKAFTREKALTAGVYYGNYDSRPQSQPDELVCRLLHCITKEHRVLTPVTFQRFAELGVDLAGFIKCVESACPESSGESVPGMKHKVIERLRARPQLISRVRISRARVARAVREAPRVKSTKPMLPFFTSSARDTGMAMPGMPGMRAAHPAKRKSTKSAGKREARKTAQVRSTQTTVFRACRRRSIGLASAAADAVSGRFKGQV